MDKRRKIQMLEKVVLDLEQECWINSMGEEQNKHELTTMLSLARKLQGIVGKETFKKLLFESFYDCICKESIYDDEADNILNSFKENFKFRYTEWDKYVEERNGYSVKF